MLVNSAKVTVCTATLSEKNMETCEKTINVVQKAEQVNNP